MISREELKGKLKEIDKELDKELDKKKDKNLKIQERIEKFNKNNKTA